jgi:hypothetical protein
VNRAAIAVAVLALLVAVASRADARPPASPAATPDLAAVLAQGRDAQFWNIANVGEMTVDSLRATAPWNSATQVGLRQGVDIEATNGDPGSAGGDIQLKAGYGDAGNTAATYVTVQGGRAGGPGYLVIETGEGLGDVGDCLMNIGAGRAAWRPCP